MLVVVRAYYSHRNETMLTCTVSMIETAIAIIAACLPALRSMIIGDTTKGASNSYGRHYELASGRRKTMENRMPVSGISTSGIHSPVGNRSRDPNGSEDSLVTNGLVLGSAFQGDKGVIAVETRIETQFDTSSNAESSKSSV
jgi:hypothetical protein